MDQLKTTLLVGLTAARDQFRRSTAKLGEELSGFRPADESMTAAQQMAHVAQVIDWLIEGASNQTGFDMDFEPQIARVLAVDSLAAARAWFEKAAAAAIAWLQNADDSALVRPLPDGPVYPGQPTFAIVLAIVEHTSHHRGCLAVYARLADIAPNDPYGL